MSIRTVIYRTFLSVVCLAAVPLGKNRNLRECPGCVENLGKEQVSALIMLDPKLFSNQSRDIAFNYDLFHYFLNECGLSGGSETIDRYDDCWKDLLDGRFDLIVFDSSDSIPEKYADKILCSVPVRKNLVWAASGKSLELIDYVNLFYCRVKDDGTYRDLVYRHYRSYQIDSYLENDLKIGALSPYDDLVRKYGEHTGLDWRLLSAIIYQESRYNMATSSSRNAKGLMQIKESTAAHYGVHDIHDPELNVKAGTLHFAHLVEFYEEEGMEKEEAIKFALGAYNAGEARIEECRHFADSLGFNKNSWSDVVEAFQQMETFGGKEQTRTYVENVLARFAEYQRIID